MNREDFERLAEEVFEELPPELLERVDNVVFVVEDWPDRETLDSLGYRKRWELLGLYQGVPLDERHIGLTGNLPDRIVLYQRPLEHYAALWGVDVGDAIYDTLLHEVGHHFGLSEEELRELEERG